MRHRGAAVPILLLTLTLVASTALGQTPNPLENLSIEGGRRAPLTFTPSFTVTEEYNDNIFFDNSFRRSDWVTGYTPAFVLSLESAVYRLAAQYSLTAQHFANNPQLDHVFDRQSFGLDGLYRFSPRLTVSLTEAFARDVATQLVSAESVGAGRVPSWSNTISPSVAWQYDRLTTLRGSASYTVQRFERNEFHGSDVYRVGAAVDRVFTPRWNGTFGYDVAFFDLQGQPSATTHTPRVGVVYRVSPTLTASASGGPSIRTDGGTTISPAASVSVAQRFAWGSLAGDYDRGFGTAGALGQTTVNQSVGARARVDRVWRTLQFELVPRYTTVETADTRGTSIDVRSLSLSLRANYQVNRWIALVGEYTFYLQRSDTNAGIVVPDVDQNRISLGLQFGLPIKLD